MCGIFGAIFHGGCKAQYRTRVGDAMNLMAAMASDRGTDATGMARVSSTGDAIIYKDTVDSLSMLRRSRWRSMVDTAPETTHALLGHTRKKTAGDNTQGNAHPFEFTTPHGVLVGTHNGTLYGHQELGPKSSKPFDSDSRNLFFRMSKTPTSAWPSLFGALSGSFAVVATRNDAVFLARNFSSPCYFGMCTESGITFYASTRRMVEFALAIGRFVEGVVVELPTYELYEFKYGSCVPNQVAIPSLRGVYYPSSPVSQSVSSFTAMCSICTCIRNREELISSGAGKWRCKECMTKLWGEEITHQTTNVS